MIDPSEQCGYIAMYVRGVLEDVREGDELRESAITCLKRAMADIYDIISLHEARQKDEAA